MKNKQVKSGENVENNKVSKKIQKEAKKILERKISECHNVVTLEELMELDNSETIRFDPKK